MKRVLMVAALFGLAFAAAAQETEIEEGDAAQAQTAEKKTSDRFCIRETGSRIVASRNARSHSGRQECVAQGGRVYTRDEIERTGSVDVADALRRLDPSVY